MVAGRRLDKLEETVAKVHGLNNGNTKALAVQTDLLKDSDVANLFAQTVKTFGRSPEVVLSNAGAVEELKIGEHKVDDWWQQLVSCHIYPTSKLVCSLLLSGYKPQGSLCDRSCKSSRLCPSILNQIY